MGDKMRVQQSEYDEIKLNLIKKSLENKGDEVFVPKERRKGDDGVWQFINFICFTAWAIIFLLFGLIIKAGVSAINIQQKNLLWASVDFWRRDYLVIAFVLTIVCFAICTFTIFLNLRRNRRRTDRIKKSLIIYEMVAFAIGIFLILKLY